MNSIKLLSQATKIILMLAVVFSLLVLSGFLKFNSNVLFVLVLGISGFYWVLQKFYLNKALHLSPENPEIKAPLWLKFTLSDIFPVLFIIFLVRSFLFEPYEIPSGSLMPTNYVGDRILANKYAYGLRLPLTGHLLVPVSNPKKGDIMLFYYPPSPHEVYVKRVIGVPGDTISYKNKILTINGKLISKELLGTFLDTSNSPPIPTQIFKEEIDGVKHSILNYPQAPNWFKEPTNFPQSNLCSFDSTGFTCTVPPENYFMMGDNRDNSLDSRYWGFVESKAIVGRADLVLVNFSHLSRSFTRL